MNLLQVQICQTWVPKKLAKKVMKKKKVAAKSRKPRQEEEDDDGEDGNPWYEVVLQEGRQNQIRMMFKNFGRMVEKLRRVKIAFLELDVAPGRYRLLTPKEVLRFRKILKLDVESTKSAHGED